MKEKRGNTLLRQGHKLSLVAFTRVTWHRSRNRSKYKIRKASYKSNNIFWSKKHISNKTKIRLDQIRAGIKQKTIKIPVFPPLDKPEQPQILPGRRPIIQIAEKNWQQLQNIIQPKTTPSSIGSKQCIAILSFSTKRRPTSGRL